MKKSIKLVLNGCPTTLEIDPKRSLIDVLRIDLGLTGSKIGCGEAICGACTVLVDSRAERACALSMEDVAGRTVTTIEGLASGEELHPIQQSFVDHQALQCGFCTPGMIMSAAGLLHATPAPTTEQIVSHMDDNLCRCGSYIRIIEAVRTCAEKVKGGDE
jgi:aerobic-type carbon monoxide dehydrogenase small subunit (CoxS/CutS family)